LRCCSSSFVFVALCVFGFLFKDPAAPRIYTLSLHDALPISFAAGGTAPAVLNAANEIAVAAFLEGRLCFADIPVIIERTLTATEVVPADSFDTIFAKDAEARRRAREQISLLAV